VIKRLEGGQFVRKLAIEMKHAGVYLSAMTNCGSNCSNTTAAIDQVARTPTATETETSATSATRVLAHDNNEYRLGEDKQDGRGLETVDAVARPSCF